LCDPEASVDDGATAEIPPLSSTRATCFWAVAGAAAQKTKPDAINAFIVDVVIGSPRWDAGYYLKVGLQLLEIVA
jgi:hypothetical protein